MSSRKYKPPQLTRSADLARPSHRVLEAQREALLRRLDNLPAGLRGHPGYASARALLGLKYMRAKLTARVKVLQTAQFMIEVLEMLPPFM